MVFKVERHFILRLQEYGKLRPGLWAQIKNRPILDDPEIVNTFPPIPRAKIPPAL